MLKLASALLILLPPPCVAADLSGVVDAAERFVRMQTQDLPGEVRITVGKVDVSRLPACTSHEAFLPQGSRLNGKSHVGVRCLGPHPWSTLVPVHVALTGQYLTARRPLRAGQTLAAEDLAVLSGDLSLLPSGIATDLQQAVGKTLRNSIGTGQPVRGDQLLAPLVVRQGQTVRVVSLGEGFSVSAEGKSLSNAAAGQVAQVRMNSGQTVSGLARPDGTIAINP